MSAQAGRILVIRGGAIGDFILTLPVLAAVRAHFPRARLEVLGYRHIAQLALAGGLADAVQSIEARSLAGFFARGGPLAPELEDYFAGFAIVLSYLYDPEQVFGDNVSRCFRGQFIAGPHRPDEAAGLHASEVFLKPLERLAIFEADPVPRLTLQPAVQGARGAVAFHPGSGSERKNWPESSWSALLDRVLSVPSRRVLLVGGEAEGERVQRLAATVAGDRVECAFQLPLPDLAARLLSCELLVGHDSGISHLAAALGLPVLALWGETAEAVWSPRGPRVRVLRGPAGLASLQVATVLRELNGFPTPR
jgi:ADP-heptose:LPS heptosyltransferase